MAIPNIEYSQRRRTLMDKMGSDSIAILPASPVRLRNRDVCFPYRQESNFYYLSGFTEPESVLVLIPGRPEGEYILFCRERDPKKEIWDGFMAGPQGACETYGADEAFPIAELDSKLPELIQGKEKLFYEMGGNMRFDRRIVQWINVVKSKVRAGAQPPGEIVALDRLIHEMRLYKSPAEIALMQTAADISARAHIRAMQICEPGLFEYQLEAEFLHEFTRSGARSCAYSSIVGGGANGCILHYIENNALLKDGDLVLIDAGAEYQYYAADITRTFPVNGKFAKNQAALYDLVLEAQLAAIEKVKPGNPWNAPHDAAVWTLTQGLVKLGLLAGDIGQLIQDEAYKPWFMHKTGHWLGMDVHDVGQYKIGGQWRPLEPGMVLTVEPGLYMGKEADVQWRGIGIRIEDDVLVTPDGCQVLTNGVPKTRDEIERVME